MKSSEAAPVEDELALVERCLREPRDREAWDELVRRYRPVAVRAASFALSRQGIRDATLAEDAASEVFTHLVTHRRTLEGFQGKSSFSTWLAVIARREAARILARSRGKPEAPERTEEPEGLDRAVRDERIAAVQEGLEQLPPRDQLALSLFYRSGLSYDEVARVVGLPKPQVSSLLARARARLAQSLRRLVD